jgi:hypothetical protein
MKVVFFFFPYQLTYFFISMYSFFFLLLLLYRRLGRPLKLYFPFSLLSARVPQGIDSYAIRWGWRRFDREPLRENEVRTGMEMFAGLERVSSIGFPFYITVGYLFNQSRKLPGAIFPWISSRTPTELGWIWFLSFVLFYSAGRLMKKYKNRTRMLDRRDALPYLGILHT